MAKFLGTWDNTYQGTAGDDDAFGMIGSDVMIGGEGDDFLDGNTGNDSLYGGQGDDILAGESGSDLFYGGQGADLIFAGVGNDTLFGDRGDDTLSGGSHADLFVPGAGDNVITDYQEGIDTILPPDDRWSYEELETGLGLMRGEDWSIRIIWGATDWA